MEVINFITKPQVLITLAAIIVLLWRISYGFKNGFVAELLEIAALAIGFVIINLSAGALNSVFHEGKLNVLGSIIKIAIVVAIYRVIQGITKGVQGSRGIPIVGTANKLLGALFGVAEVYIWIYLLNYIIGFDFIGAVKYTIVTIVGLINA